MVKNSNNKQLCKSRRRLMLECIIFDVDVKKNRNFKIMKYEGKF